MNKGFVCERTMPTPDTNSAGGFDNLWYNEYMNFANCKSKGKLLFAPVGFMPKCAACTATPASLIIDKSSAELKTAKGNGNLIHNIKCFGMIGQTPNMCEIDGDSTMHIKGTKEETDRDGLPVITLVRDYQISGGVAGLPTDYGNTTTAGITLGILTAKGQTFATIEPAWNGNTRGISCIPEGEYFIRNHNSPRFGECIKVFDIDKTNEVRGRSDILIHAGNWITETRGCIILGERFFVNTDNRGNFRVSNSQNAMNILKTIMTGGAILKITSGKTNAIKNTIQ